MRFAQTLPRRSRPLAPLAPLALLLLALALLSGCAANQGPEADALSEPVGQTGDAGDDLLDDFDEYDESPEVVVYDPLEPLNRAIFSFNDVVYTVVLNPAAEVYDTITPPAIQRGIGHFFHNLGAPVRIVSNLLQGEPLAAGVEFSRFFGNTVFGLGVFGYFDDKPAVVEVTDEDLGQTLGVWGFGEGFYLVLPILGPSTLRDTVGMAGETFLDPLYYVDPAWISYAATGLDTLNKMPATMDLYFEMKGSAVEPYTAFRNAYIQMRRQEIKE